MPDVANGVHTTGGGGPERGWSSIYCWTASLYDFIFRKQSIEQPRSCTQSKSYHSITITEEIELPEDHSLIMPSNGFGEAEGADLTIFQELYPKDGTRNSRKNSQFN